MSSPVIVPSQIWISFQKFLSVSFMLVYHHIWSHSHQSLPSNLYTGSFVPLKWHWNELWESFLSLLYTILSVTFEIIGETEINL